MLRSRDGTSMLDASVRAGTGAGGPAAGAPTTVLLPNIPRTTDEKSKVRYLTDYEKYEPELRKHHLGAADASTTVGLKDVPADFNRAVPSLSEPTAAEREYERNLKLKAKMRRRSRFYAPPKQTNGRSGGAMDGGEYVPPPAPAATAQLQPQQAEEPAMAAGAGGAPYSGTPADANTGAPSAASALADKEAAAFTGAVGGKGRGGSAKPVVGGSNGTAAAAAAARAPAVTVKEPPEPPVPKKPRRVEPPTAPTAAATVSFPTSATAAAPSKEPKSMSRTSPAPPRTVPPKQPPSPPPPPPQQQTHVEIGRPASPFRPPPQRAQRPAIDVEKELQAGFTQLSFPLAGRSATPGMDDPSPPSADVAECAALLRVLVDTPEEYMASFHLDTDFFDLAWMKGDKENLSSLTTIQNAHFTRNEKMGSGGITGRWRERLTSPRSVLVMLRNGVAVEDLQSPAGGGVSKSQKGSGSMRDPSQLLPEDPELRSIVQKFRAERDVVRREQLSTALQRDYANLCQQVSLPDLVNAFRALSNGPDAAAGPRDLAGSDLPTSVAQRVERQQKMFAINKIRLQRQLELMKGVHEREEAAEKRKAQLEAEAQAVAEQKAREEAEARAQQQARLEAQKRRNAANEEAYQAQLAERLQKAEARNKERMETQERLVEERQKQRAAAAAERKERFARNAQLQAAQAAEVEQRRREKEAKLEELSREREARVAEERKEMEERQARAVEAREAARRRAQEAQLATLAAALEKQQEVEARLRTFQLRRAEDRAARAQDDAAKELRRQEAMTSAQQQQQAFRDRTKQRAVVQDATLSELQHQRAVERTIRVEHEREEAAAKRYAVQQKQRLDEFSKLRTIAKLLEKRAAADSVTQEREEILKQSIKAREALDAEKERLRRQLEAAKRQTSA